MDDIDLVSRAFASTLIFSMLCYSFDWGHNEKHIYYFVGLVFISFHDSLSHSYMYMYMYHSLQKMAIEGNFKSILWCSFDWGRNEKQLPIIHVQYVSIILSAYLHFLSPFSLSFLRRAPWENSACH